MQNREVFHEMRHLYMPDFVFVRARTMRMRFTVLPDAAADRIFDCRAKTCAMVWNGLVTIGGWLH